MKTLTLSIILMTNTVIGLGQNLISNWKFQDDTSAIKCQDWYDGCGNELTISCDTLPYCHVSFSNQSPSVLPEDVWSLQLKAGFQQAGFAETYITGQGGTMIYQLKFYMKSPDWLGSASIGTVSQNQFVASTTISDTTSIWKQYSFIDTLTTLTTDTIAVRLSAGIGDFCICTSYFDLIELTVIDTTTSIKSISQLDNAGIKIYPNPSNENITIDIVDNNNENHILRVYGSAGQLIKTIQITNNILTFDNRDIESGLYFYQIQRITDKKIIGQGKFIVE